MKNKIKALIKDGFLHIMGGSILIKLMSFISSIVVVRLVTKEDYGILAYADNLYSYVAIIAGLGMSTGIIVKCCSKNTEEENNQYFNMALKWGIFVQVIGSIAVVIYFLFFSKNFSNSFSIILMLFLYPAAAYIIQTLTNFIRAYQENKLYSKVAVMQSLSLLLGSAILAFFIGIRGIVIARYLSVVILFIVARKFIKSHCRLNKLVLSREDKKSFLIISMSLLVASFFSEMMYSNEMFLVNKIIGSEFVTAEYKIATLIPAQILFVTQSLLIYVMPKFVEYKNDEKKLWSYSKNVGILNFITISVICVIAILLTPLVVKLLYGKAYIDTISLSVKFWVAYSINAAVRMIPLNVLAMTGGEKINAMLSVLGCGVHFLIAYIILKFYTINQLPVAISAVYILIGGLSWIILYRRIRKDKYE